MDKKDLSDYGIGYNIKELVLIRAKLASESGIDGIVSSGHKTKDIRKSLGKDLIIVNPGIRPSNSQSKDDQKRIVTAATAINNGADFIVVGRPIRNSKSPRKTAEQLQTEIANSL